MPCGFEGYFEREIPKIVENIKNAVQRMEFWNALGLQSGCSPVIHVPIIQKSQREERKRSKNVDLSLSSLRTRVDGSVTAFQMYGHRRLVLAQRADGINAACATRRSETCQECGND
jgi:hypothetical protein